MFHNQIANSSAKRVVADHAQQSAKKNVAAELSKVIATKKAGFGKIASDLFRLSRGRGKITSLEYVRYQLYRSDISDKSKMEFISDRLHWPICDLCSSPYWRAATEDKWLSYAILGVAGIPVPQTVAVFDPSNRMYGNTPTLRNASDIEEFLNSAQPYPLFVKPNDQIASFGACIINAAVEGRAQLHDGSSYSSEEVIENIFGSASFLLQKVLRNHSDLASLSPNLATVRLVNLVRDGVVDTPFVVLKIPGAGNIADNFWRSGNMLADVDGDTGVVRRVVRRTGLEQEIVDLGTGLKLPMWMEVRDVNEKVARLFAPVAFSSLDLAITSEGPVVVEINSGSSFDLIQVATGKGFLIPSVVKFFAERGWRAKQKRS